LNVRQLQAGEVVEALVRPVDKSFGMVSLVWLALASNAHAQTIAEGVFGHFSGTQLKANMESARAMTSGDLFFDKELLMPSTFSVQGTVVETKSTDSHGVETKAIERRANIGYTQNFGKLTTVGFNAGYIKNSGYSRFTTVNLGQWWNKATILTDLSYSMSKSERQSRDYLDTDGLRIIVPPRVDGKTLRLGLTWLATTNLMLINSVSTTTSSDRPRANFMTAEGRYFFAPTLTALHLGMGRYYDTAQVNRSTDYGRISSDGYNVSVHQHLSDQWILSLLERDHFETEVPRSVDSQKIKRHTQEYRMKLRWRYVTGPVTEDVTEVYGFAGLYKSYLENSKINHVGIGGKYVF
jgi:hypothetical protein